MESSELQIGDWVKIVDCGDDKYVGTFAMVAGLNDEEGAIRVYLNEDYIKYYWSDEESDFKAVEVTPEILEKNGFKRIEPYEKYEWNERNSEIWIIMGDSNDGEKLNVIHINSWQHRIPVCYHNTIQYVHHLQQALRLCGIDKKIKL